jgi:hypothetical protein
MSKSLAILLLVTMLLIDGACWLHQMRADQEAALIDQVAAQVELNRMALQSLGEDLDNLNCKTQFALSDLRIFYEHFRLCSTWNMEQGNPR